MQRACGPPSCKEVLDIMTFAPVAPPAKQQNVKTEPKVRPLTRLRNDVKKASGRADMLGRRGAPLSLLGLSGESRTSSSSSGSSSSSQTRIELNCSQELWLANELQKGARLVQSGERTVQTSALQHKKGGGWSI